MDRGGRKVRRAAGRTTVPRSARYIEGSQPPDRIQFAWRRHRRGARPGADFARTQDGRQRGGILSGRMYGAHRSRRILPPDHGGEPRTKSAAPHHGHRVLLRVRLCPARSFRASCAVGCARRHPRLSPDGCIVPAWRADRRATAQNRKRYILEMGANPGLQDAAIKTPPPGAHVLSREELVRYRVETSAPYESDWMQYQEPKGPSDRTC
jgi:hypothetical protein